MHFWRVICEASKTLLHINLFKNIERITKNLHEKYKSMANQNSTYYKENGNTIIHKMWEKIAKYFE
jgi:hypothetical protein